MSSKKKVISSLVALSMLCSSSSLTAFADVSTTGSTSNATVVKCITQNGDSTDNITSTVNETTGLVTTTVKFTSPEALNCYPKNESIGRNIEGYWCGFDVIAPSSVTDSNLSDVNMQYWGGSAGWIDKDFSAIHDNKTAEGNYHITLWETVNHQYLSLFSEVNKDISYYWQFDWDGDDNYDDRVVLTIDPEGVTLNPPSEDCGHVHDYSVECKWDKYEVEGADGVYYKSCAICGAASDSETFSPYGSFEFITNDGENPVTSKIDEDGVKTTSYRFTSPDKLQWYPANSNIGRYQEGYWIGFKIIAPSSVTSEVLNETGKPVQYMTSSDGGNTWSAVKSFTQNNDGKVSDGRYYMGAWVPTNHNSLVNFAEYGVDMKWIYKFDWNKDGVYEDIYEVSVDPKGVELVVPEGEVNGGTHTHGAGIKCTWDKYKVADTDGVYYKSCEICGAALDTTFADPIKVTTAVAGIELYKNDVKIEDLTNTTFVKDDVLKIAIIDGYRLVSEGITVGKVAATKNEDGTYSYTFTGEEETTPLAVVADVVKLYTVTFENVVVKNGEEELTSGDEVDEGTVLTVEAVAKDGYTAKVFVNGKELSESTVTVTSDVKITVEYTQIAVTIPQNVKAVAGDSKVTLTWDAVENATQYIIKNGGTTILAKNIKTNTYTFTGLTNGTTYKYTVFAQVGGKWSAASAAVTATPKASNIPQNVKAVAGDGEVTLTWDAVPGATQYIIKNGGTTILAKGITTNTYTFTGLTNGTTYTYTVFAMVDGKWSAASSAVSATPNA